MRDLVWPIGLAVAVVAVASIVYVVREITHRRPPLLSVHWTKHARERMREREITEGQVMVVLADPQRRTVDLGKSSVRLERDFDGRTLKVWAVESEEEQIVVKSAAWSYFCILRVPGECMGRIIGRQGRTVREIEGKTGARIYVRPGGTVRIRANDRGSAEAARTEVESIVSRSDRRRVSS